MPENNRPWWANMVVYWLENQVVITLHSDVPFTSIGSKPIRPTDPILSSLKLNELNQFLSVRGFTLTPFTSKDVPHLVNEQKPDSSRQEIDEPPEGYLNTVIGKYFFPAPSDRGTIVVSFFHVSPSEMPYPMQDPMGMYGSGMAQSDGSMARQVVKLINGNLDKLRNEGKVPIVGAMPNWLSGSTPDGCPYHSCPIVPPIPVPAGESCGSSPGLWPITLPDLKLSATSSPLYSTSGKGVTVFVLDSMPDIKHHPDLIAQAATSAGIQNSLLKTIATQKNRAASPHIKFTYQDLPDALLEDAPELLLTGKDVYGRLFGFESPDHGLFISGMIRDLVPNANIEYIRVLNDFGVGDSATVIAALEGILGRMLLGKDLYNQPVVINMSLVSGPSQSDLIGIWFGDNCCSNADALMQMTYDLEQLRSGVHFVIQCLTALGAVIVASAGNDSDVQSWRGTMIGDMSPYAGPRYPAAWPEVISVGAVDKLGRAAHYSCYPTLFPNHNGIATYGGGIPTPIPPMPDPGVTTQVDLTTIDAARGVFSSSRFPKLSADDPNPDYPEPNANAWAYWSGTSFATPIISAVAARVLENIKKTSGLPTHLWSTQVQYALTNSAGQKEMLTGDNPLPLQPDFSLGTGVSVSLLMAYQCEK